MVESISHIKRKKMLFGNSEKDEDFSEKKRKK